MPELRIVLQTLAQESQDDLHFLHIAALRVGLGSILCVGFFRLVSQVDEQTLRRRRRRRWWWGLLPGIPGL